MVHVCSCSVCCGLNSVAWRFGDCGRLRADVCIVLCSWGLLAAGVLGFVCLGFGFGGGVSFVVIEYCWFS